MAERREIRFEPALRQRGAVPLLLARVVEANQETTVFGAGLLDSAAKEEGLWVDEVEDLLRHLDTPSHQPSYDLAWLLADGTRGQPLPPHVWSRAHAHRGGSRLLLEVALSNMIVRLFILHVYKYS